MPKRREFASAIWLVDEPVGGRPRAGNGIRVRRSAPGWPREAARWRSANGARPVDRGGCVWDVDGARVPARGSPWWGLFGLHGRATLRRNIGKGDTPADTP